MKFPREAWVRAAAGLALVLSGPQVRGDLSACPPIATTPGFKVVIDRLKEQGSDAPAPLSAIETFRLKNAIDSQVAELKAERPTEVATVPCSNRWPAGTQVFTRELAEALDDLDVLLELWGETGQDVAFVYYAVIPVLSREFGVPHLPGIYPAGYALPQHGGISRLFRQARELKAYVALSLGVKSLERARAMQAPGGEERRDKTRSYNDARRYFCSAENLLQETRTAAPDIGPSGSEWEAIIGYAAASARRAAELARADPQYIGALKLLTSENLTTCGRGGD